MDRTIKINPADTVAIALKALTKGEEVTVDGQVITVLEDIPRGHKFALVAIPKGTNVIKYGAPIGHAITDVPAGGWVHTHNVKTNLNDNLEYEYNPKVPVVEKLSAGTFMGYPREKGNPGIRNEVWLIPTVGCVNGIISRLAKTMNEKKHPNIDGVYAFTHPFGCSQLGDDHENTQKVLAGLVNHPNAGAVLVMGLGCENNLIAEFKKVLGDYNPNRVKFLNAQSVSDEYEKGLEMLEELYAYAAKTSRQPCSAEELVIGLKCGGSDGFSGITANPLLGKLSDKLVAEGGSTILTEVPEMFGAETILMERAADKAVFDETVTMINSFKDYYKKNNQPIYENPSPGNKEGGITTLEDKSLGCTQKGGTAPVVDVLNYGEALTTKGLNLLYSPGNDLVASTALAASGAQMVLFTTGRGTPFGSAVPTLKISTNTVLAELKPHWIDFDAGVLATGTSFDKATEDFYNYLMEVASGKKTNTEDFGFREISIFKTGVTL